MSAGRARIPGAVRRADARDLDRVAALWTAITHHHAHLDPLFRMRANAEGKLRELLGGLHRDSDAGPVDLDITRAGPIHIALFMTIGNTDHESAMSSIRRFGDEVIPLIEKEVGPLGGVNVPKPMEAAQ